MPHDQIQAKASLKEKHINNLACEANSERMSFTRKGFTLTELLMVIAIIAILMSMLLPALKRVKMLGMETLCRSNLRQLSFAMNNYAFDYDGWATYSIWGSNYLYGPTVQSRWGYTLCPYIGYPVGTSQDPPAPVSICPSGRRDGTGDRTESNGTPNFSYAFNYCLCRGNTLTSNRGEKITNVREPSRRLYCADAIICGAVTLSNNNSFSRRHGGSDNIIFVDGHTEKWGFLKTEATGDQSSTGFDGFWHDSY
jgi:prepilin-type N-terminal cleavage/methylation domain-containing protein/prepilin-type processing-associated H-X9-DG protein